MNCTIMPWVDVLPEVRLTDFQSRRDEIAATLVKANQLMAQAKALRAQAYFDALRLEGEAKQKWSIGVVEKAKAY